MVRKIIKNKNGTQEDKLDSKLVDLARTTRVTGGGKHLSFRAGIVVGDRKGRVGFGIGKSKDTTEAINKAFKQAKKNMFSVHIANETIPHKSYAKYGPARVFLFPQQKGRGIVAGGVVRVICNFAGIKNISSKIVGKTKNKINNALATIEALKKIQSSEKKDTERKEELQKKD